MAARRTALGALAGLVLLGGCAELPFLAGNREQGSPQAFEMQGRVYVRFGPRAFSGSLRWQHELVRDEVWLGGPLGQTGAHIVRDASGATLTTADQQVYRALSIESLTKDGLGWSLPLADLSYYVLGTTPTGIAKTDVPGAFVRDGWQVRWTAREGAPADAPPLRLDLLKEEVEIRLVVDRLERGPLMQSADATVRP